MFVHLQRQPGLNPDIGVYNTILDILWEAHRFEEALTMMAAAIEKNVYKESLNSSDLWEEGPAMKKRGADKMRNTRTYTIDLHEMSHGAAKARMMIWLATLDAQAIEIAEGRQDASSVPQDVNIVIGQGKHSTVAGVSTMRTGVLEMISAIKIPLAMSDSNPGMLFGDQKLIMEWLQSARQGVKMTNKLKKNKQKSYKYWCNRATSMLN